MPKDKNGNTVNTGDVLISWWCGSDEEDTFSIWEMPKTIDGHGYQYSLDGTKSKGAWFWAEESIKIPEVIELEDFFFSFRHGMNSFDISKEGQKKSKGILSFLSNSNWSEKRISIGDIESYTTLQTIVLKTMDDVVNNLELLKSRYVPHNVIVSVLRIFGGQESTVINGELGIARFDDMLNYSYILAVLSENK